MNGFLVVVGVQTFQENLYLYYRYVEIAFIVMHPFIYSLINAVSVCIHVCC